MDNAKRNFHFLSKKSLLITLIVFVPLLFFVFKNYSKNNISKQNSTEKNKINQVSQQLASPTPRPLWVPGNVIIKLKQGVTEEKIQKDLTRYNAKIIKRIPQLNRIVLQVPTGEEKAILDKLSQNELIQNVELNETAHGDMVPNDPFYAGYQWHLKNNGQPLPKFPMSYPRTTTSTLNADIHIEQAWDVTQGNGIKVAILDTGIDLNHPDLQGVVIAQKSFVSYTTSVQDDSFHGTFDAGLIAANTNNGIGVAGVCPGCKLLVGKVLNNQEGGNAADVASGMIWAADQGAQVLNMSLSFTMQDYTSTLNDAVNYTLGKGVIIVESAGNCGDATMLSTLGCTTLNEIHYPAKDPRIISVAATSTNDEIASFSTYGTWVTIAAPGVDIASTWVNGDPNGSYQYAYGTSMSAPITTGVVALILSTGVKGEKAKKRLCDTADKIPGTGTNWQCGRVNAAAAVGASTVAPTNAPIPSSNVPMPSGFVSIGDCISNGNCPPTDIPSSFPNTIEPSSLNVTPFPTFPNNGNPSANNNDLLGIILQILRLIIEFLSNISHGGHHHR